MGRTGEESLHLQVYSAASDESSGKSFMEPDDEALMNLLALPFLCRAGSSLGSSSVLFTYAEI